MPPTPKTEKPPKQPAAGTEYEVSILVHVSTDWPGEQRAWLPVGRITTRGGAPTARRKWADDAGDKYNGEQLRAVPTSNINEGAFDVAIFRKLTPKAAPASA